MRVLVPLVLLVAACTQSPTTPDTPLFATASITATAKAREPFTYHFTTQSDGAVSARIQWVPRADGGYTMNLRRLVNCTNFEGVAEVYLLQTGFGAPPNGDWTITVPGALASAGAECWEVKFWPYTKPTGQAVSLTLAVTTP